MPADPSSAAIDAASQSAPYTKREPRNKSKGLPADFVVDDGNDELDEEMPYDNAAAEAAARLAVEAAAAAALSAPQDVVVPSGDQHNPGDVRVADQVAAVAPVQAVTGMVGGGDAHGEEKKKKTIARRHVSCGEPCIWEGATPNGAADEDELEASQTEIARLKKLVEILTARVEAQQATGVAPDPSTSTSSIPTSTAALPSASSSGSNPVASSSAPTDPYFEAYDAPPLPPHLTQQQQTSTQGQTQGQAGAAPFATGPIPAGTVSQAGQ
ncbi:fungal specific transcription factor [Pseudohyphozyma bogoriensis]|nr:fungal specific transcription factor [Pseudohyphozyma bogoriensis]